MEEEWMTGARYDTGLTRNLNGTQNNKSLISEDGNAILGIESVYNDESRDEIASNHSSGKNGRSAKDPTPSPRSVNDEEDDRSDVAEEDIMWKCAKCPLEFSDKESVKAHVLAVHKKIHPAQFEEKSNNEPAEDEEDAEDATAEYEIEYVNDNDDNSNDPDDAPNWSPGQYDDHHSLLESPKSSTSRSSNKKKTWATATGARSNKTANSKKPVGRPPKRNAPYSPLSNNLSDEEYNVNPVRINSAKKPKPWATPSISCDICFTQVTSSDALRRHMEAFTFRPRIWKCTSCPRLFMDKAESDEHFDAEHPEDKDDIVTSWSCDSCDRTFEDEYDLAHHETFHGVKAPWGCRCCGRTFERANPLRTHEHAEVNKFYGGGFKCTGCGEAFLTAKELTSHQKLACNNPATLKCETCDRTFNNFQSLQKHRLTHSTELPWNCTRCDERFREKAELSIHLKETHGEDNTSACNTCGRTFGRTAALRQHELICQKYLRDADDEEEERDDPLDDNFDMDEDDVDSPKSSSRQYQKKRKPGASTSDKKWRCQECGTSFSTTALLKQHSQIHSKKLFDCSYCPESFARQQALEAHEMKRHAVERKYPCRQCSQRFVGPAQLKQHIVTAHIAPNGIFKCTVCSKLFSKKEYLQIHSRIHIGERRFKCTELDCEELFNSPQARTQHLLAVHGLTEQVFKCKDCGQEFEKQRELERHELIHEKEKPLSSTLITDGKFKCTMCDKSFLEQFLLNMHQKQHEQTEYKCDHCDKKFKNIASRNIHTKKLHADAVSAAVEEIVLD